MDLLDKNQLYVHLSEIGDEKFGVSESGQGAQRGAFTRGKTMTTPDLFSPAIFCINTLISSALIFRSRTEVEIPDSITRNLNPAFEIREYQEEAFARFIHCFNKDFPDKEMPLHLLFNMATGSGKTLIMAGLILYLYETGIPQFSFFRQLHQHH